MGFLLMGLTTDSDAGLSAAVLYILVYAVMTCAFLIIYLTSRLADGRQLLFISDFRSLTTTS
jgi:NADH:ubiquinone oxidoreductase subunit 2 (subunit N)